MNVPEANASVHRMRGRLEVTARTLARSRSRGLRESARCEGPTPYTPAKLNFDYGPDMFVCWASLFWALERSRFGS